MLPGIQADDVEGDIEHLKGGLHLDLPQGVEQGCIAGNHLAGDQAREDGEHSFVFVAGKFSELSSKGFPQSNLLLDIWHVNRGNIDYSEIAAMPREYLKHVELDDAGPLEGSIMEDTLNRRRLPGEGDFDIAGFLRAVAATGYDGVYGVEILSETQRQLFPAEAAQRSFDATMAQFAKA